MQALYEERNIDPEPESVPSCQRSARSINAYDAPCYASFFYTENY
jgi:hypothetical protein